MLQWILEKTDKKKIIVLFTLAALVYVIMMTITIPTIREGTGGIEIFDLRPFGYNVEVTEEILSSMSKDIKDYYRFVQIPLDFIYPLLMGLFGAFTLALMRKKVNFPTCFIALPLIAGVCDYLENIFVFLLLSGNASALIVRLASGSCILKSMLTTLFMTIILFVAIFMAVSVKKQKRDDLHVNP